MIDVRSEAGAKEERGLRSLRQRPDQHAEADADLNVGVGGGQM